MAYMAMAEIGVAYMVMAYIAMACVAIAYTVMAYIVTAPMRLTRSIAQGTRYGLYGYRLHRYGLCSYGLCSYRLYSGGLCSYGTDEADAFHGPEDAEGLVVDRCLIITKM